MVEQTHELPKISIPGYLAHSPDTLEDGTREAKVVVEKTGLLGRGIPIYIAPYTEVSTLSKGHVVITIHNGHKMYTFPEHTPDKWVKGG